MLPAAAPPTPGQPRARARRWGPAAHLRTALLLGWLALALATVLVGQRAASLDDLRAAVDAGRVAEVRVSGGLEPGATGSTVQAAVWREGLLLHRVEGLLVSPGVAVQPGDLPDLGTDLAEELRAEGVRVLPLAYPSVHSDVLGWRVPQWVGALLFAGWLAALFLLVGGPVPERATRWAWFWLNSNPLGVLAFLLLSGPTPGVPAPRPGARRLTGGWAFLLSLVLGGAHLGGG